MNGANIETGFTSDTSKPTPRLSEADRRKPDAVGVPIRLADGEHWLLARPVFSAKADGLTRPHVDDPLNRLFDRIVTGESIPMQDVFFLASRLLRQNYRLDESELEALLTASPGRECQTFLEAVTTAVFGDENVGRNYTDWVRASLIANGLQHVDIPADDLPNVMAILVATNRTVPASNFIDACLESQAHADLESLV